MKRTHKLVIGAAALAAIAGGGVAVAASGSSPSEDSQAVINDAAKQLGIAPSKLSDALKQALINRIDAAVASGRITKAQGDALKQRINSSGFPLIGGFARGFHHGAFIGELDAAAKYLGVTEDQLRSQLESGKTLAQIAKDKGKSVDGLVDALVAAAKTHVDAAVQAGRLTQSQADQMLSDLRARLTSLANGRFPAPDGFREPPPFGFRHFFRAPA